MTAPSAPRGRLLRKYALTLAALVAGALVVSGAVQIWFAFGVQRDALVRIENEKAASAARAIEQFVAGIEGQLGWTSHAGAYTGPEGAEQQRFDFIRLLRQAPSITELSWLDDDGREQLRTSRVGLDVVASGDDHSAEPAFMEARDKGTWHGRVYFHKESEPYMTIALAGRGRGGGVTVAEVNLKFIWDVIADIEVGESGRAYVVDQAGRLIAHPDIGLVLRRTELIHLPQVAAALAGATAGAPMVAPDPEGREALSLFAPILPLGWRVFVDLPLDEANRPLYASMLRTVALVLVGVLLAAGAGLLLARRMTGPIHRLQAGAARIGGGDLADRIEIRTHDELEVLAGAFNDMAERLSQSYAGLEGQVADRTRALEQKNQELETLSTKLAKYLAPQVYDSIFAGRQEVQLASQRKKLTVFFSDIAGFTETTDQMESEDLTQLINHYLTEMARVALDHGATIDKYIGDAIMVFFGDPETHGVKEDALACVTMAIAMQKRMQELSTIWRDAGIAQPLRCRIGIHTGYCTVGNFGSEDRMDYTIIGGTVNLASRLEHEAPPGGILISYETYALVKHAIHCEEVGRLRVRGIAQEVGTWRVIDRHDELVDGRASIRAELPHLTLDAVPSSMSAEERAAAASVLRQALDALSYEPTEVQADVARSGDHGTCFSDSTKQDDGVGAKPV
ncbi:MAG: adenylate/guanylate cyclase domain-containing protein [Alphaproteobacteria bacterium]